MESKVIEVIEFTDPVCTWCWGSEPLLRTLETRYGSQIKLSYIMGGLVKDINLFYDSHHHIGGNPEESNQGIAKHWLEASKRHGMPVKTAGFKMFTAEHTSTYPQNIAYKAAQMQDEAKANRFLRRIRESSASEAQQTNSTEILLKLASEVGLDIAKFLEDFTNGNAQKAFEDDLHTTAQFKVHGFPSFLVKYGEKSLLLRGYQTYENLHSIINTLSHGEIQEKNIPVNETTVLDFISRYQSVAPAEIKMAFHLSTAELDTYIDALLSKQQISKQVVGNGLMFIFLG